MKSNLIEIFELYLDDINFKDKSIIEILKSKEENFGDYSSNISLKLAKKLNKSPLKIADQIKDFLENQNIKWISKISVTKPGFVNLFLANEVLIGNIKNYFKSEYKPSFFKLKKMKINYEYVSANPTGDLHIGHARNAIVGKSTIEILKYIGHEVFSEYYINDGGNQMLTLAESVYFYYCKFLEIETSLNKDSIGYHGIEIKEYAKYLYENKIEIIGETERDKINFLSNLAGEYFLNEIKNVLKKLGITKFDKWTSEKELLETKSKITFDKLKKLNNIYEKDGAIWIKTEKYGDQKDRVLLKSDGSYTYMFADIANHIDKNDRGFDKMIDLWGKDHHGYEPRIQASLKAFNVIDKMEVDYISMVQLVRNNEIVKMSKRSGTSLRIKDILEKIDADVLKYFILSKNKEQDMEIDIDLLNEKKLTNQFYYVQYTNARIFQILKKYKDEKFEIKQLNSFELIGEDKLERKLLLKMLEIEDEILSASLNREPLIILTYLKELCQVFNSFYSHCRIISDDNNLTLERINLLIALKNQLNTIFNLIGITPINKI